MIGTVLYVTLLLQAQTDAEWVEISQQHYHRPTRHENTEKVEVTTKKVVPWSSGGGVEDVTTKVNVSSNRHWGKGHVHRVSASVARGELDGKPGDTASRKKTTIPPVELSGEVNNSVTKNSESAESEETEVHPKKVLASVGNKNNLRDWSKGNSAASSESAFSNSDNKGSHISNSKNDNSKRWKGTLDVSNPDGSLEIFEITIPKDDGSTTSPVRIKPFINKGSSHRIYLYSTEHSDKVSNITTEEPLKTKSKAQIGGNYYKTEKLNLNSSYFTKKPDNSEFSKDKSTTKRPFSIDPFENKANQRRIYIKDIRKPSEVSSHDKSSTTEKSTVNYHITNNESVISIKKTNRNKESNRISTNHQRRPEEQMEFMTQDISSDSGKKKPASDFYTTNKYDTTDPKDLTNTLHKSGEEYSSIKTEDFFTTKTAITSKPNQKQAHITKIDKLSTNKPPLDLNHVGIENSNDSKVDPHANENNPNRRIDISFLTTLREHEFVTKQEISEDNDPKNLYVDAEETVNKPTTNEDSTESFSQLSVLVPNYSNEATLFDSNERISNPTTGKAFKKQNIDRSDQDMNNYSETNKKQTRPLENVIKFMKLVSDTITKNTHRNIKSKMRYLEDLRDTLLMNIEEHVHAAWPDDESPPPQGARGRSRARREARGHVDFPSSESALMSISFLTFAVFLIKLVLQVISTYKNNSMMAPAVFAVSRAAAAAANTVHDRTIN